MLPDDDHYWLHQPFKTKKKLHEKFVWVILLVMLRVGNKNIRDNDLVILVMEMYEVYVDVGNKDQVLAVAVVVVDDINEYYDFVKVIVYVVLVEVDIEMLLYMVEMIVEYVLDDYSVVEYNKLVQNKFPDHLIVEYYSDLISINQYYLVGWLDEV
jgi:hypothetical protein